MTGSPVATLERERQNQDQCDVGGIFAEDCAEGGFVSLHSRVIGVLS